MASQDQNPDQSQGVDRPNSFRSSERKMLERYRQIVETSEEGIWEIDSDNKTTFVSPKMSDMLGYHVAEMAGVGLLQFVDDEGRQIAAKKVERLRPGLRETHQFKFKRKNGNLLWTLVAISPYFDEQGTYRGALAMVTDMTRQKEAAERSQDKRPLLALVFQYTLSQVAVLDPEFNYVRVNDAYARAAERDVSEFPGNHHFDWYPSEAKTIFEKVVRTKESHRAFARPYVFPDHPERGVTYWDWTLVPVFDDRGEVDLLVFSLNDVTDGRKNAARLEQAQRAAHIGSWEWDLRSGEFYCSDEMGRLFSSFEQEQVHIEADFLEAIHPDDRQVVRKALEEALKHDIPVDLECRNPTRW